MLVGSLSWPVGEIQFPPITSECVRGVSQNSTYRSHWLYYTPTAVSGSFSVRSAGRAERVDKGFKLRIGGACCLLFWRAISESQRLYGV